jgi:hypothetical protein
VKARKVLKLLGAVASLLFASAMPVSASVIFDNGPAAGDSSFCFTENNTSACGGGGNWVIYNAFMLSSATTITGFTYNAYWESGSPSDYTATLWNIWGGNPESATSPLSHGTITGTLSNGLAGSELVTVTGLDVTVGPGLYWLGIGNDVDSANDVTTMAYSNPAIAYGTLSSNGNGIWDGPRSMAFTVEGSTPVPLPSSLLLMATALAALAGLASGYSQKVHLP